MYYIIYHSTVLITLYTPLQHNKQFVYQQLAELNRTTSENIAWVCSAQLLLARVFAFVNCESFVK